MANEAVAKCCFVIGPISGDGTAERRRSDQILRHIISPIVVECEYSEPDRADHLSQPGLIGKQIIGHLLSDDLVVADLTGKNANVFYELAIRHAVRKPMVQLINAGEDIPFDLYETRTIQVDHTDLDSVDACKKELKRQILEVENDPAKVDTPLSVVIDLQRKQTTADPIEKVLLQLMDRVSELAVEVQHLGTAVRRSERATEKDIVAYSLRELEMKRRIREVIMGINSHRPDARPITRKEVDEMLSAIQDGKTPGGMPE